MMPQPELKHNQYLMVYLVKDVVKLSYTSVK